MTDYGNDWASFSLPVCPGSRDGFFEWVRDACESLRPFEGSELGQRGIVDLPVGITNTPDDGSAVSSVSISMHEPQSGYLAKKAFLDALERFLPKQYPGLFREWQPDQIQTVDRLRAMMMDVVQRFVPSDADNTNQEPLGKQGGVPTIAASAPAAGPMDSGDQAPRDW
jgi:hypothetical protein